VYGFLVRPLFTFWLILGYQAFSAVCRALDPILYRSRLAATEVNAPVFIVGNPRSGTTFIHRWLVKQGFGVGFQLWQLLFPSLTARAVLGRFVLKLEALSPAKFHGTKAHPTSLDSVETDDVLVLFRFIDGLFLYGYTLAWDEKDWLPEMEVEYPRNAPRDFAYLREAMRANLVAYGAKRAVGKLFSMAIRPRETLEAFPDCKMLYMVRDPVEVVPSAFSLVTGVLQLRYPWHRADPVAKARWIERFYQAQLQLYKRFHDVWVTGVLPKDRVHVVRYDRLMTEFDTIMPEICAFLDHPVDGPLAEAIRKTAEKQRSYRSEHTYDLSEYGLTEERIRRDFAFVYDTYGIPNAPAA
jgi:hypothetical protein